MGVGESAKEKERERVRETEKDEPERAEWGSGVCGEKGTTSKGLLNLCLALRASPAGRSYEFPLGTDPRLLADIPLPTALIPAAALTSANLW
jgi:hypothetical protein